MAEDSLGYNYLELSDYLRIASRLAVAADLTVGHGEVNIIKPISRFISSIASMKSYMDLDFVFASLVGQHQMELESHRGDNEFDENVFNKLTEYYSILRTFYEHIYNSSPSRLVSDREQIESFYLYAYKEGLAVLNRSYSHEESQMEFS